MDRAGHQRRWIASWIEQSETGRFKISRAKFRARFLRRDRAERSELRHFPLDALAFPGDRELKGRTGPGLGFHPDPSAMPPHDSLADGQADAGAGNLPAMQPLEDPKNP